MRKRGLIWTGGLLLGLAMGLPALAEMGAVIEPPIEFFPNAYKAAVAFDGQGRALAAWGPTCSVEVSRSSDNGVSWSTPRLIVADSAPYSSDFAFELAFGGGTWILVWQSNNTLGGTLGGNYNVLLSRSVDHGVTWTYPVALSTPDLAQSEFPSVATNGAGTWVVVWRSGVRIMYVRSTDGGASWGPPKNLGSTGTSLSFEIEPDLATDGSGTWVAVWPMSVASFQWDVRYARTTDNGATWSASSSFNAGTAGNNRPSIAADGQGDWIAAWETYDADDAWGDLDIVSSHSTNGGLTWNAAVAVNSTFMSDGLADDRSPMIEADGHGDWVVAWNTVQQGGLGARSTDQGATWTAAELLHADGNDFSGPPHALTTDRHGNWLLPRANNTDLQAVLTHFRLSFATTCASDLDGDGFGSAGEASCPLGPAIDCDDGNIRVTPAATQLCDGSNNDCTHPAWPALTGTNELDGDGDGLSACGNDCDDADGGVWAPAPGTLDFVMAKGALGAAVASWTVPGNPGAVPGKLRYDTLRDSSPAYPRCDWSCLESDDTDTSAVDLDVPGPGAAYFYLVKVENPCRTETLGFPECP